jgi:hypothetical protein
VQEKRSVLRESAAGNLLQSGKTYNLFDTPVKHADGSIAVEIFHDITEQERARRRFRDI